MTISMTKKTAMAVLIVICGATVSRVIGQQASAPKIQPLRVIQYDGDMATLLAHLAGSFDVTIGLETDPKQPKSQVSLYVRDATFTDVLNAIVKSAPRYKWRELDGCIEVLPVGASSPLLDTLINNFRVTDVDQTDALNRLMNLPDVQNNLRAMSLSRKDPGSASTQTKSEKFSTKFEALTMRQALCRITKDSGGRFWIFQTFSDGSLSVSNSPR